MAALKKGANPFALGGKKGVGPKKIFTPKIYSIEEQKKLLEGYIEIPEETWHLIGINTHVRYISTDPNNEDEEKFNYGGYVAQNPFDVVSKLDKDKIERGILLTFRPVGSEGTNKKWRIGFTFVKKIFIKISPIEYILQKNLEKITKAINEKLKILDAKISQLK
jgi:hypothetical protein